jgi:CBS domain-containing protein
MCFDLAHKKTQTMVRKEIGRVLVTDPRNGRLIGILTRGDVLRAYSQHLTSESKSETKFVIRDRKR